MADLFCEAVSIKHIINQQAGRVIADALVESGTLQGKRIKITGKLWGVHKDAVYNLRLQVYQHPIYGEQYNIVQAEAALPRQRKQVELYLQAVIKGVGPKKSSQLFSSFAEDIFTILNDPDALQLLTSKGVKGAQTIVKGWQGYQQNKQAYQSLVDNGCTEKEIGQLQQHYGQSLASTLQTNPYLLFYAIPDLRFAPIDKLGSARVDLKRERLLAAATNLLSLNPEGHTWFPLPDFCEQLSKLLPWTAKQILKGLQKFGPAIELNSTDLNKALQLQAEQPIIVAEDRIWLASLWVAERLSVDLLHTLSITPATKLRHITNARWQKIWQSAVPVLNEDQQKIVRSAVSDHKVTIITGGPGTGKTTLIKTIHQAISESGGNCLLTALTGKAARRLTGASGLEASTLHRLLYSHDQISADALIIDEASMIDSALAGLLATKLAPNTRLILVGDVDQLPPVSAGQFFADICQLNIPLYRLTTVYRQQAVSKIKLLASEVQQKLAITLKPSSPQTSIDLQQSDCYLYAEKGAAACRRLLKVLLQEKLPALGIRECKVLIPQYKGDLGIDQINPYLQELLNPAYQHKAEWDRWGTNFRQDDPVIWLKNEQDQLVNGSELLIHSLALQDDPPTVTFSLDDQLITRPTEETYIALAYALSVHKSQGSEYEAVILLLQPEHRYSFNQRLLYTAITRAARLLIIIGSTDLLESASHNQKQLIRRTSIVRWWQQAQYLP